MGLMTHNDSEVMAPQWFALDCWPAEADLILSALEAGAGGKGLFKPREPPRQSYRVVASLRLFSDSAQSSPWRLYTRDITTRSLGFITPHRLPLGYGGVIDLPAPNGSHVSVSCTILRCRLAAPGWYEGALNFNREQFVL